jgi:hypothetical protein
MHDLRWTCVLSTLFFAVVAFRHRNTDSWRCVSAMFCVVDVVSSTGLLVIVLDDLAVVIRRIRRRRGR